MIQFWTWRRLVKELKPNISWFPFKLIVRDSGIKKENKNNRQLRTLGVEIIVLKTRLFKVSVKIDRFAYDESINIRNSFRLKKKNYAYGKL